MYGPLSEQVSVLLLSRFPKRHLCSYSGELAGSGSEAMCGIQAAAI